MGFSSHSLHSSTGEAEGIRNEGMGSEVTKERVGEALVSLLSDSCPSTRMMQEDKREKGRELTISSVDEETNEVEGMALTRFLRSLFSVTFLDR